MSTNFNFCRIWQNAKCNFFEFRQKWWTSRWCQLRLLLPWGSCSGVLLLSSRWLLLLRSGLAFGNDPNPMRERSVIDCKLVGARSRLYRNQLLRPNNHVDVQHLWRSTRLTCTKSEFSRMIAESFSRRPSPPGPKKPRPPPAFAPRWSPRSRQITLSEARSRLYQHRFWQPNTHLNFQQFSKSTELSSRPLKDLAKIAKLKYH